MYNISAKGMVLGSLILVICLWFLVSLMCIFETGALQSENEIQQDHLDEPRPDIVIIVADDMGWGDIGTNWPKTVDTPNLDLLAKQGLRLTDFHSGSSVCSPSRAALLTGRLGMRTGVLKNFDTDAVGGIPPNETTVAEVMHNAGYRTAMLGKWHLGLNPGHHPLDKGFQSYFGIPYSVDMGCADPPGKNLPQCPACPAGSSVSSENLQYNATYCFQDVALPLYSDRVIIHQPVDIRNVSKMYEKFAQHFIMESSSKKSPYFLYAALTHIHVPLAQASQFHNSTGRGDFADTLREMDWLVGSILKAVINGGNGNNTLIWFISDNGPWAVKCDLAGSVGPFTGDWQRDVHHGGGGGSAAKRTVWEGGHRMPSIVHWPAYVKAGSVTHALVSALDIMPTIAAVSKAHLPQDRMLDGLNVLSVLLSESEIGHQVLFHPNSGAGDIYDDIGAVRIGPYKVVYYSGGVPDCSGHSGPSLKHLNSPLVFHLEHDPAEGVPLDPASQEYKDITWLSSKALLSLRASIHADNTSQVDYSLSPIARPCCSRHSPICRCPWD